MRGRGRRPLHRRGERQAHRPAERAQALHLVKVTGAMLLIANLDRLSWNAAFLLTLRHGGVRFVGYSHAGGERPTLGIMALVADQERGHLPAQKPGLSSLGWPKVGVLRTEATSSASAR
jgi:hypothetical protein